MARGGDEFQTQIAAIEFKIFTEADCRRPYVCGIELSRMLGFQGIKECGGVGREHELRRNLTANHRSRIRRVFAAEDAVAADVVPISVGVQDEEWAVQQSLISKELNAGKHGVLRHHGVDDHQIAVGHQREGIDDASASKYSNSRVEMVRRNETHGRWRHECPPKSA